MSLSATVVLLPITGRRYASRLSASREPEADRERSTDNEECQDRSKNRSQNVTNDMERGERFELPILHNCSCCIVAAVKIRWATSGYTALKTIDCLCRDGALVIRGSVSSYYYKQMAQESVRGAEGIRQIVNELTVAEQNETRTNARFDVEPNE